MRTKELLILAFILIIRDLNAQSDFKPGYAILNNNDTLFGNIDSRGDIMMSKTCRIKSNNSDSIFTYVPGDILEYRFLDGKCYVSRSLESGASVFLEYLIKGKLNVYYYRDDEGTDCYLVDKEDLPLRAIPFKEEIIFRDDGTRVLYQSKYHIGILHFYTNDAYDFRQEPVNIIKPDHNNLIRFAEEYHNTVCKDEKCIIYEKEIPSIKASIELFYGLTSFNKKYINENNASEIGSLIYFWMPRASERLYFKTGLQRGQFSFEGDEFIYFVLPVQIQYHYAHYKLRPKIYFGINNYFAHKSYSHWTTATGCGLDYNFSKRISITSNFTAEFVPLLFKPMELLLSNNSESITFLSYSIYFGLRIDI